jgi:hypothetical protein
MDTSIQKGTVCPNGVSKEIVRRRTGQKPIDTVLKYTYKIQLSRIGLKKRLKKI